MKLDSKYTRDVGLVPLSEYPRPQMQRDSYLCLNGTWEYAVLPEGQPLNVYQGSILVPFSPETMLSGVEKRVTQNDVLYYRKIFTPDPSFTVRDVTLLHFTAVDYACKVWLNGTFLGEHKGGFLPFSFDVSDVLEADEENVLTLEVRDPTDTSYIARGKQVSKPGSIWYTSQSGIWGTVWMESMAKGYAEDLLIVPDIDLGVVNITVTGKAPTAHITVLDEGKPVAELRGETGTTLILPMPNAKLWSPESPHLYDLTIDLINSNGLIADTVRSYFGMRKFSVGKDREGVSRLWLNNEPYFHNGVLDQGYFPDGLLTPPTDEAMEDDIRLLKEMGFTMVRKHIKIEPLRWYYHCDRLGILVWQDMVNGGGSYNPLMIAVLPFLNVMFRDDTKLAYRLFSRTDATGRAEFEREAMETVDLLKNVVSIAMWVPFNEGWGQFDSDRISERIMQADPTRTVDRTSGWHDQKSGDFVSKHIYFTPIWVPKDERCYLLSEFGGFSRPVKGHQKSDNLPFGYRMYFTQNMLQNAYRKIYEKRIIANIPRGLSACVFTQLSDVEGEINGLITYDRRVDKMDRDFVKSVNEKARI
ncbi:MAG: glycoside hydrolase family 2 [Clostridia bacterium]|nr:glycoside hydrolase family 2 [Clostridia bacterium]